MFFVFSDQVYQSLVGFLVLVRIWRFVRIGHGIIEVTHQLAKTELHEVEDYAAELESILQEHNLPLPASCQKRESTHHSCPLLEAIEEERRMKLGIKKLPSNLYRPTPAEQEKTDQVDA